MSAATPETSALKKTPVLKKRKTPFSVHLDDDDYQRLKNDIQSHLRVADRLPPLLIENCFLIQEGDNAAADRVITYIRGILNRLSQANYGIDHPPVNIYLADVAGPMLGVIDVNPKIPHLIVGLGFIEELMSHGFGEDHLAGALAHERFHIKVRQKWPDQKNSRGEEEGGDIFAVFEAYKAGYNPKGLGELFLKLKEAVDERKEQDEYNGTERGVNLLRVLDPHPAIYTRYQNTNLALAALQHNHELTDTMTPIPASILRDVRYLNYVTNVQKMLMRNRYSTLSVEAKVDFLAQMAQMFEEMPEALTEGYARYSQDKSRESYHMRQYRRDLRFAEFITLFDDLLKLPGTARAKAKAKSWALQFLGSGNHSDLSISQNGDLLEQFLNLADWAPPILEDRIFGRTREDEKATRERHQKVWPPVFHVEKRESTRFINAITRDDAVAAVKKIMAARKVLGRYRRSLFWIGLSRDDFTRPKRSEVLRRLEDGPPIRLPWEYHLRWAKGDGESETSGPEDSALIAQMMTKLGAKDSRIPGYTNDGSPRYNDEVYVDEMTIDRSGWITHVKLTEKEIEARRQALFAKRFDQDYSGRRDKTMADLLDQEYRTQLARDASERDLVMETNWKEMAKDFWAFVETHRDLLEPSLTIVEGRHPFAAAFTRKLRALCRRNPTKWQPISDAFFLGKRYEGKEWRALKSKATKQITLPDLIVSFKETYHLTKDEENSLVKPRGTLPPEHPMAKRLAGMPDDAEGSRWYQEDKEPPEKQTVRQYILIDPQHPYARALLALEPRTDKERAKRYKIFRSFHLFDHEARSLEGLFRLPLEEILGFKDMRTAGEFRDIVQKLPIRQYSDFAEQIAMQPLLLLVLRRVQARGRRERFPLSCLDRYMLNPSFPYVARSKLTKELGRELVRRIKNQIKRNIQIDFDPARPVDLVLRDFVGDHACFATWSDIGDYPARDYPLEHNLFLNRPKLEQLYNEYIRGRIEKLPNREQQKLLGLWLQMEIRDPETRQWATQTWIKTTAEMLGKDHGDPAYQEKANKLILHTIHDFDGTQGAACIIGLLDAIEAQKELSFSARDQLFDYYSRKLLQSDGALRALEIVIESAANDSYLRRELLHYLSNVRTKKSSQQFLTKLKQHFRHDGDSEKIFGFDLRFAEERNLFPNNPQDELAVVELMHQNFTSAPTPVRLVALHRILYPEKRRRNDTTQNPFDYVLDKLLPPEQSFSALARECFAVYQDQCPEELRTATYSALLASRRPDGEDSMRPGQILTKVVSPTGVAGGRILQGGHSILSGRDLTDPEHIQLREDLRDSKVALAPLLRWEVFEQLERAIPAEAQSDIARYGGVLGKGATAFVVACVKKDGSKMARKVMLQDIVPQSNVHFNRYEATFTELAKRHPEFLPMLDMIQHAREALIPETDGRVAAVQIQYSESLYNSLTVQVGQDEWRFRVAPVLSSGEHYVDTELAPGNHFNDLPIGRHRSSAALAIDTAETYLLLSGVAINPDVHGGQQKIDRHLVTLFDPGGIAFDMERMRVRQPSREQNHALGQALGYILNDLHDGEAPIRALIKAVSTHEWGENKSFLVGIQRAFLARQDYQRDVSTDAGERQAAIFSAILRSGNLDPNICAGLSETLSYAAARDYLKKGLTHLTNGKGSRSGVPKITLSDGNVTALDLPLPQIAVKTALTVARRGLQHYGMI